MGVSRAATKLSVKGALRVRVSGRGVPAGDTQPLVAASVPGRPGARAHGPAIPARVPCSEASHRGSEGQTTTDELGGRARRLAKGLLPVWGSGYPAVRIPELRRWVPSESALSVEPSRARWPGKTPCAAGQKMPSH